ncbi:hypothetical protein O9929_18690 [Vibrio lentus]|nr:hypothetical protein [Vibrio lentus]
MSLSSAAVEVDDRYFRCRYLGRVVQLDGVMYIYLGPAALPASATLYHVVSDDFRFSNYMEVISRGVWKYDKQKCFRCRCSQKSEISPVWIVPIIAVLVGAGCCSVYFNNRGAGDNARSYRCPH